jgi:FAD/FMN-containing dehydrogenase
MTLEAPAPTSAARLRSRFRDLVQLPGDARYDELRTPWNVAVDQRPAAVAAPTTSDEVAAIVRAAGELGLRIAPQGTGHGAAMSTSSSLSDALLLRATALTGVTVDAERRIARVGSGVLWQDVASAAGAHGLAALHGSSPNVGVAGFSLGGGIGWYSRKLGLAANSVTAVEVVTADGVHRRADAVENHDLFWALRGGGGNFGVVTALELRVFDIPDAYAGMLMWDIAAAEPVLRRWVEWTRCAPDEVTTAFRIERLPAVQEVPEFLRGRNIVVVDGAVLADDDFAVQLLAPLRALEPELDTFARIPAPALTRIHMDPDEPVPFATATTMLQELDEAALQTMLDDFGADSATTILQFELRQLGGALARPLTGAGALSHLDGAMIAAFIDMVPTPEGAAEAVAGVAAAALRLAPWSSGAAYLNFADGGTVDPKVGYGADAWLRLQRLQAKFDPNGMFLANHPIR